MSAKKISKKKLLENNIDELNCFDDGTVPDLSQIDWGKWESELNEKQKFFIFWFTYPGTKCFMCQAKAARKAGYKAKDIYNTASLLAKKYSELISVLSDRYLNKDIEEAYKRAKQKVVNRANLNIADYFKSVTVYDKDGNEAQRVVVKDLKELTPEQLDCIDGIKFEGQYGIPNFTFGDREKAIARLQEWYNKANEKESDNSYDVKLTLEGIKDKLEVKMNVIKKNEELTEAAETIETPENVDGEL